MNYSVGQIIYLLSRKDIKVFPVKVIEEIKRKTIDEELISHVIRLPNEDKTEILLDEISADVFVSLDDLEKNMIENAKSQIKRILQKTKEFESIFDSPNKDNENNKIIDKIEDTTDEKVNVDLGDGVIGKLNLNEIS